MPVGKDGNASDRKLGEFWEDRFCDLARRYGWEAWPFQRKKGATFTDDSGVRYICPDVWILRRGAMQYAVEVKHKTVSRRFGGYGFESYRADSLLALQRDYTNRFGGVVSLYSVHNWYVAGGESGKLDKSEYAQREDTWFCQRLDLLQNNAILSSEVTYYNGAVTRDPVPIWYYPHSLFIPLVEFLK